MWTLIKATVTTNCEDDEHMRVRVKSEGVWQEESELLSSLNSIYLEVDDVVMVLYDTLANPVILGKYKNFEQENPIEGQVLFSAKKEDSWIVGTLQNDNLHIESSEGFILEGFHKNLTIQTPNESKISYEDDTFKVELKNGTTVTVDKDITVDADGGKIILKNSSNSFLDLFKSFLDDFYSAAPTTQGSPAAQQFTPAVKAIFDLYKQKFAMLFDS